MNSHPIAGPPISRMLQAFKEEYCNENVLIAEILLERFKEHLDIPILDVGAGLGDLAEVAFPKAPAILLDTECWGGAVNPNHRRVTGDFFDYVYREHESVGTLLLAHVMQYLDEDEDRFLEAVAKLDAPCVITVLNDNVGPFGELVLWALDNLPGVNAERPFVPVDIKRYRLASCRKISPTMNCPSFEVLAAQFVTVILDVKDSTEAAPLMEKKMRSILPAPSLIIDQSINFYER